MASPTRAVFLSYASQDAEAAGLIAGGLQGIGLEVWFDKSELRGGDAWDSMIRRQVKECGLFIPVISATTEGRSEGYFRLEWKLAVDRSHLMADDQAFIVPVVIDGTREGSARVPEGFHARQWTRLPGGRPTPEFVERIRGLLDPHPNVATGPAHAPQEPPPAARRKRRSRGAGLWAVVSLAIAGAFLIARPDRRDEPSEPRSATQPAREPAVPPAPAPPPTGATTAVPEKPVAPPTSRERAKIAVEPKVNVKRIETGPLRPAVLTNEDVQPIQVVQTGGIGAPKPTGDWHIQVELAFWETIKTSTMVEDFEEYLKQYPDGRFAGLARNRIKSVGAKKR